MRDEAHDTMTEDYSTPKLCLSALEGTEFMSSEVACRLYQAATTVSRCHPCAKPASNGRLLALLARRISWNSGSDQCSALPTVAARKRWQKGNMVHAKEPAFMARREVDSDTQFLTEMYKNDKKNSSVLSDEEETPK